jgi:hypothetical protein
MSAAASALPGLCIIPLTVTSRKQAFVKAIIIEPRNFAEIKKEVSWRFFQDLKRRYKIAQKLGVVLFFIPHYMYPQCAGIKYQFVVSEENIQKNFIFVGYQDMTTNWMYLVPKQLTPSEKAKSVSSGRSSPHSTSKLLSGGICMEYIKSLDDLPVWAYMTFRKQIQSLYYWEMYLKPDVVYDQVFWPAVDMGMTSIAFHHASPWTEQEADYRFASAREFSDVRFLAFNYTNHLETVAREDQLVIYFELDWIIDDEWKAFQYAFLVVKRCET